MPMNDTGEGNDKRLVDEQAFPTLSDGPGRIESDFEDTATGQDLVGQTLGHFEIVEMIGRGGMGVVYLALDTKLDRHVAIKYLPQRVINEPATSPLAGREARLLASLNHPNIASIYEELKEAEGGCCLVLEYVPGQTLAERIAEGPLGLEEVLTIALQISEALAAAHEHGVIHRDLKPGNIKITPEGQVKVLDFGIGKATGGRPSGQQETTIARPGKIIGTPAYMSPEQARGKPVDTRMDIWSFGCVVFEMLSGQIPFKGDTIADMLACLIDREPDWELLPRNTPRNMRVLLRRCLTKNPRRRLRDIGDAAIEIGEVLKLLEPPVPEAEASSGSSNLARMSVPAGQGESLGQGLQGPTDARQVTVCPYRGLRPFEEEDAPFFFGREAFVARLAEVLAQHTVVAVVGASGSGKSSVVRAGLVPYKRKSVDEQVWEAATLVPGEDPLRALAAALVPFLEPVMTETDRLAEIGKLADHLAKRNVALKDVVARALERQPDADHFLLIVDQWEELYTLVHDDRNRWRFIDELLEATESDFVAVVLTLRGDFFGHILTDRALADRLQDAVVNLGPMTREELEHAITAPARKVGLAFEPGLVSRILDDVEEEPGRLPLLEFVLALLWERRRDGMLLHEVYEGMGEVQGAIARRAEEVFGRLSPSEQQLLRQVFLQLVRPGEKTEDTRRRATIAEMSAAARQAVQHLADARLIVTGRSESTGEETMEVAHEALISNWARLRSWLDEDREFLLWRHRLRTRLEEWENMGRQRGALLHGTPLAEAESWLVERGEDISPSERNLVEQSVASRKQEAIARERSRRRVVTILTACLSAALVLVCLTGWQWHEARKQMRLAVEQKNVALARELALQAGLARNRQGSLLQQSVLLALESLKRDPSPEANQALRQSLSLLPRSVASMDHEDVVSFVVFSPDGKYIATASYDRSARVWETISGNQVACMKHDDEVASVAFSPDGEYLATASYDGTARVWEANSGKEVACVRHDSVQGNDSVFSVAFCADGKYLATAGWDRTARIWDAKSGQEVAVMHHRDAVYFVAFSPDAKCLATASGDSTAGLWTVASGEEVARMNHEHRVCCAAFSPDGKYLATGSWDKSARVWETTSGREIARMDHEGKVQWIAFGPNGKHLATASDDKTARVWEADSGKQIARMDHESLVYSVTFSPRGGYVATACGDDTARVWELSADREVTRICHGSDVGYAVFSPDGRYLATASYDKTAGVWEAISGKEVARMSHDSRVTSVAFSPDGRYLATASNDKTAGVWEATSGEELSRMSHDDEVLRIAFSPDGKQLATGSRDKTARVWEAASGKEIARMDHEKPVVYVAFSPRGKHVATASGDESARVWETASGKEVARMRHDDEVLYIAFSPDGKQLATGSRDKTARVWETTSGEEVARMRHEDTVTSITFSPDGKYLATASWDESARVWETTSGKEVAQMIHGSRVRTVVFSPDGKYLATASYDDTARIWEVTSGKEISRMSHDNEVPSIAFSPDSKHLATASPDKTARVWETTSGREVARMSHDSGVRSVVFSPNGKYLATRSEGNAAEVWFCWIEDLIDEASCRLTRNLTYEEWQRFFPNEPYSRTCSKLPIHPTVIEAGKGS